MNFETVSLLMNWLELGALFAILSRLGRTFDLIASTQRELRRAIHHLGEYQGVEFGADNSFGGPEIPSISPSSHARGHTGSAVGPDDLAPQSL
jgi:hypothetical protein